MKQIINGLLYDTEKAEKIIKTKYGTTYYKTANGRYFSQRDFPIKELCEESEYFMKLALAQYPDAYQKLFGKVEDA